MNTIQILPTRSINKNIDKRNWFAINIKYIYSRLSLIRTSDNSYISIIQIYHEFPSKISLYFKLNQNIFMHLVVRTKNTCTCILRQVQTCICFYNENWHTLSHKYLFYYSLIDQLFIHKLYKCYITSKFYLSQKFRTLWYFKHR